MCGDRRAWRRGRRSMLRRRRRLAEATSVVDRAAGAVVVPFVGTRAMLLRAPLRRHSSLARLLSQHVIPLLSQVFDGSL